MDSTPESLRRLDYKIFLKLIKYNFSSILSIISFSFIAGFLIIIGFSILVVFTSILIAGETAITDLTYYSQITNILTPLLIAVIMTFAMVLFDLARDLLVGTESTKEFNGPFHYFKQHWKNYLVFTFIFHSVRISGNIILVFLSPTSIWVHYGILILLEIITLSIYSIGYYVFPGAQDFTQSITYVKKRTIKTFIRKNSMISMTKFLIVFVLPCLIVWDSYLLWFGSLSAPWSIIVQIIGFTFLIAFYLISLPLWALKATSEYLYVLTSGKTHLFEPEN